jgi:hypothetical protein
MTETWRKNNKEHINKYRRESPKRIEWHLKTKYNITAGEHERMKAEQDGKCAICHEVKPLEVDHDHKTNNVRDLLCGECNRGIAQLKDSPMLCIEAAKYLKKHKSRGINWNVFSFLGIFNAD